MSDWKKARERRDAMSRAGSERARNVKRNIARRHLEVARMENSDMLGVTATEVRPDASHEVGSGSALDPLKRGGGV